MLIVICCTFASSSLLGGQNGFVKGLRENPGLLRASHSPHLGHTPWVWEVSMVRLES